MSKMKKLFPIIFLICFCSCSNSTSTGHKSALPGDSLINDVIYSVIRLDSLNYNHSIVKFLTGIKVYPVPYWPTVNTPVPPPPPGGYYYHQLIEFYWRLC